RRRTTALGGVGLRPSEKADAAISAADLIAVVQQEIPPLDKTFFRTESKLAAALTRLDGAWRAARHHLDAGSGPAAAILRAREAAAMIANARWVVVSALARRETRGLNRRLDFPQQDPALTHRLRTGGLDQVWLRHLAD
ncbi:MAG: FAD-binding protein, partial [Xanthobacteraceae bacterium]